jgi:hypothetical protein
MKNPCGANALAPRGCVSSRGPTHSGRFGCAADHCAIAPCSAVGPATLPAPLLWLSLLAASLQALPLPPPSLLRPEAGAGAHSRSVSGSGSSSTSATNAVPGPGRLRQSVACPGSSPASCSATPVCLVFCGTHVNELFTLGTLSLKRARNVYCNLEERKGAKTHNTARPRLRGKCLVTHWPRVCRERPKSTQPQTPPQRLSDSPGPNP